MVAATDKVTDSASDKAVANAWRLVADVGGTNARFAVASDEGSISLVTRYSVDQYPSSSPIPIDYSIYSTTTRRSEKRLDVS